MATTPSQGDNNMTSIYDIPHIKSLMIAERNETDPENKRLLHNAMLKAMKEEQIKRGQRTPKAGK
jgi:hypothetical protein